MTQEQRDDIPLEVKRADLDAAAVEGIITADQAARLFTFLQLASSKEVIEEERVQVLSGFQDVFLTIGAVLVLVAATVFGSALLTAPLAWVFAEILVRRPGTRFSMIAMAVAFVLTCSLGGTRLLVDRHWFSGTTSVLPLLFALVAAGLYAARFRTPFAALLIAGAAIGLTVEASRWTFGRVVPVWLMAEIAFTGVLCFAVAMTLDLSDRLRLTRRADAAFWLHMAAAPALSHGLIGLLIAGTTGFTSPGFGLGASAFSEAIAERPLVAAAMIGILLLFAVVALIIDRRSLMVSSLLYFIASIGALLRSTGWHYSEQWSIALLLVGLFVFSIGMGWKPVRAALLSHLPHALTVRLAP